VTDLDLTPWSCTYCGADAYASQGGVRWCHACDWRHDFATCEPQFHFWMEPTPTQQLLGLLMSEWFSLVGKVTPIRWIIDFPADDWRTRFAAWVFGNERFYWERWEGLI
jgi:hypothetical protein